MGLRQHSVNQAPKVFCLSILILATQPTSKMSGHGHGHVYGSDHPSSAGRASDFAGG